MLHIDGAPRAGYQAPQQPQGGARSLENLPLRSESSQGNPRTACPWARAPRRAVGVQSGQLLAKSQILEDEILTGAEDA